MQGLDRARVTDPLSSFQISKAFKAPTAHASLFLPRRCPLGGFLVSWSLGSWILGSMDLQRGNSFQRGQRPRRRSFKPCTVNQSTLQAQDTYFVQTCRWQEKISYHRNSGRWRWISILRQLSSTSPWEQSTPHWDKLRTLVVRVRLDPWAILLLVSHQTTNQWLESVPSDTLCLLYAVFSSAVQHPPFCSVGNVRIRIHD